LAAGNTVVVKPAELTPLTALKMAELVHKAGLPKGVFNVVTGSGAAVGTELVSNPEVDGIAFTGSVETGIEVMQRAAKNVTRVVLELGGKNPNIVFPDADFEKALQTAKDAIFTNAGQMCWAGSRLLLHQEIHDKFMAELKRRTESMKLGPGLDEKNDMGPLVSRDQQSRVLGYIKSGMEEGAKIVTGGGIPEDAELEKGNFVKPTIFYGVNHEMKVGCEEIFGPVLSVFTFQTTEEAMELANATKYGLYAGVWTNNLKLAHQVAARIEAGVVSINEYLVTFPQTPFGGYKDSGIGYENGLQAIGQYTRIKNVSVNLS
jgi:acyl-CoA reductase-like NAD-dependent aldehyde dehydrogenase